jgi:hypothetical protein
VRSVVKGLHKLFEVARRFTCVKSRIFSNLELSLVDITILVANCRKAPGVFSFKALHFNDRNDVRSEFKHEGVCALVE